MDHERVGYENGFYVGYVLVRKNRIEQSGRRGEPER